jgi:predicted O-linked N-acetylglucosamine transferase (SPINDLY family)
MTQDQSLTFASDWQQQAYQYLLDSQYDKAAQLYEQAVEIEPNIKSYYWHLGLMLLLQGQETEAQTTWLFAMMEGDLEDQQAWSEELIEVLEIEAERRRLDVGDYKIAWVIRQHIREIDPTDINNLLHIVGLSTLESTYTPEKLAELGIIEKLQSKEIEIVDESLLTQIIKNILDLAPFQESSYQLVEASIPYVTDSIGFINILIPVIYKMAYSARKHRLALKFTEQGLRLNPKHSELLRCVAWFNQDLRNYSEGIEAAKQYYDVLPNLGDKPYANLAIMRGLMSAGGRWDEFNKTIAHQQSILNELIKEQPNNLSSSTAVGLFASTFFFPYFQDNPSETLKIRNAVSQLAQKNIEINSKETVKKCRQWQSRSVQTKNSTKRLKIGYISHCLKNHSVGWLARWLFQHHNRDKFEIYGYFLASEVKPRNLQQWYLKKVDKAHRLEINSIETAEKIAEDEIDILVDLDSITLTDTCEIMAIKPAPIQVTWLGWDASGVPNIDYYIADPYVLPEDAQNYYSEKIWRLPQTYIAVDGFEVGIPTLRRQQLEIPDDAIIYFTGQNGYKYNPETARLQVKILKAVPNSYFVIKGLADQDALKQFYTEIAESEGVSSERFKLLPLDPSEAVHRANLLIADVVLDTYPYNGATTTLETLWMEVPMVTRVGQQFASRNSYTMMINAGITEGIAWTDEEYIEWGIRLGTDESLRQQVAWKLRKSKQNAPLWNGKQFTHQMEKAYQQMWQNYLDGKH